jgi:hypothetical protein
MISPVVRLSSGSVIRNSFCRPFAPSIAAAS